MGTFLVIAFLAAIGYLAWDEALYLVRWKIEMIRAAPDRKS